MTFDLGGFLGACLGVVGAYWIAQSQGKDQINILKIQLKKEQENQKEILILKENLKHCNESWKFLQQLSWEKIEGSKEYYQKLENYSYKNRNMAFLTSNAEDKEWLDYLGIEMMYLNIFICTRQYRVAKNRLVKVDKDDTEKKKKLEKRIDYLYKEILRLITDLECKLIVLRHYIIERLAGENINMDFYYSVVDEAMDKNQNFFKKL